jgi:hypothetical protein
MLLGLAIFVIGVWVVVKILSRKGMTLGGAIALAIVIQVLSRLFVFIAIVVTGVLLFRTAVSGGTWGIVAFQWSPFFGAVLGLLVAYALPSTPEAARMQHENRAHLVACPECGRKNAVTTRICPQCGHRKPQQKNPLSTNDLAALGERPPGELPTND